MAPPDGRPGARSQTSWTDGRWHVRTDGDQAVLYDQRARRCWRAATSELPEVVLTGALPLRPRVRPALSVAVVGATVVVLLADVVVLAVAPRPWSPTTVAVVVLSVAVHVALHEAAHVVVLRSLGRQVDGVGVKLNHVVFPAVYVRMNQSLLLCRTDQALVHVAGLTANVALVTASLVAARLDTGLHDLAVGAQVVTVMACANAAPVLGSDGYRVLLALTATPARRRLRDNPGWLVVLKLAGVLLAVVAGWRLALLLGHAVAPDLVPAPAAVLVGTGGHDGDPDGDAPGLLASSVTLVAPGVRRA